MSSYPQDPSCESGLVLTLILVKSNDISAANSIDNRFLLKIPKRYVTCRWLHRGLMLKG
jgi:hypothetical protein